MQMLAEMKSQQELEFSHWVQMQPGGAEDLIKHRPQDLLKKEDQYSGSNPGGRRRANEDDEKRIKELKAEYREDVEDIVKENFAAFERKFNMGISQMKDELAAKIDRQGDRVISAVTDGPHKRIKDKVTFIRTFKIKRS
jgi:hypothetical protein